MSAFQKFSVLHVALEPASGVWSVMRDLSQAQVASGRYRAVAMGVIASSKWPSRYAEELKGLGLTCYQSRTLDVFGTAKFLWQRVQRPPIGAWARDLLRTSGASSVVVHFHNAWLSGVFLPIRSGAGARMRTVVTFHGVNTTLERQPARRWLHRCMAQRLLRYDARLTSVDAGSLPAAHSLFGLPPERFTLVPNGVEAEPSVSAARWDGTGDFVVGYVGLLAEHKGWRIIADAVLQLRAGGRNVRLLIAGGGPQESAAREKAQEHPEAIELLGYVSSPRQKLMPQLHILSLMSAYEGLPMVLIEAASVGLPVVATSVGGVPEIVADGVTGLLVPRSVESLARALETLYDSPELIRRMGQAARAVHAERFELGKVADRYHLVYNHA
ncbi:MAG: glycosyltransferase family 4 protein [Verrucomicrobia bacterium]|nr:glycosyltransferase family 4 protein [Verrucomicrobiota bacterium]